MTIKYIIKCTPFLTPCVNYLKCVVKPEKKED